MATPVELPIDIGAFRTEIDIAASGARTVDIGFVHNGDANLLTMVFFSPGIYDFVFRSVTLGDGVILLDPNP